MYTFSDLIQSLKDDGSLERIARDPRIQFGTPEQPMLGAGILPVVTADTNVIEEDLTRLEAVIADDGSPNAPPAIKASYRGQPLTAQLGHIDLASQMSPRDLKEIGKLLNRKSDRSAARARMARFLQSSILLGLAQKEELQRWQAIVSGRVQIKNKNNNNTVFVELPKPTGHRVTIASGTVAAPTGWYNNNYDPMPDILLGKQKLADLGYDVSRIITRTAPASQLAINGKMIARSQSPVGMQLDRAVLGNIFGANDLPVPEVYDKRWRTQNATFPYLADGSFVMLGTTGREETLTLPGSEAPLILPNTFGYQANGISIGQDNPGKVLVPAYSELKPVGVYAEGYCESFPMLLDYEAIYVITIPTPTP